MRIESERVYLRRFEKADAAHIWELHKCPDTMKYTRMGRALSPEESLEKLEKNIEIKIWAAFARSDDSFVGWFGFWESEDFDGEPELGFMIKKALWGQGYTTEAAMAILEHFDRPRVHALTAHENLASQRVLDKLGFQVLKETDESKHFIKVKADGRGE